MEQITRRQEKLLRVLINTKTYMSAKAISNELQVSEKTIRNEISAINKIAKYNLIDSCKGRGYRVVEQAMTSDLLNSTSSAPAKRQILILKHILSHKSADFYDLAEQYFISESTLEKDIRELNEIIAKRYSKLRIQRLNNQLTLDGSESEKREMTTYFLINEIEEYDFNFNNYVSYFKYCNIIEIKQKVLIFLKDENIKVTDIAIVSLILHLGIMIDRVYSGNFLTSFIETNTIDVAGEKQCQKFCEMIEDYIEIELPKTEKDYLKSIFFSKISLKEEVAEDHNELKDFIDDITEGIYDFYQVDLRVDSEFKQNLLIHLISLTNRAEQNKYLMNPLIDEIRDHFPLIYDMSVYISLKIQEKLKIKLYEDEIGYISLHLMCAVEKLSLMSSRILLVNPNGSTSSKYIMQKLHAHISPNINFVEHSYLDVESISTNEIDLVLTTIPFHKEIDIPIYKCSAFINNKEIEEINELLRKQVQLESKGLDTLKDLFDERLFFSNLEFENKEDLIRFLCEEFKKCGYTDEKFIDSVMKRERIAPTAFGNDFAIPHPAEKIALHNGIAVASLKKPIAWGEQKVQLVFLFALSKEKDNLSHLYEVLVSLLDDISKVKQLIQISNYEDFMEIIEQL